MPELPEVETIKRDLEKTVLGKKIIEVQINNPKVIREPDAVVFKKSIEGATIKNILRKAKVIVMELSNNKALVIHLKMTGQLVYPGNVAQSRVSFRFSDDKWLDFNDQRLFAELRLMDDWKSLKFIRELGPEPFQLSEKNFKELLISKKSRIKPLLMDQTFISGIGNLYAAEILYRSRINPGRPADSLTDNEKALLFKGMKDVLKEAIDCGGSSIDDYVRVSGKKGNYAQHHKVYGKENQLCPSPGCKTLIKRIAMGGRGTYFCPKCQK